MRRFLAALLMASGGLMLLACNHSTQTSPTTATGHNTTLETTDQLKAYIGFLSSDELGGRQAGSPEGRQAADYLVQQFKTAGLKSFNPDQTLGGNVDSSGKPYLQPFPAGEKYLQNVVGYIPGSDATLKEEAIIIGAHYDHLGRDLEKGGIYHGADDNASGVSALITLAGLFSALPDAPKRTIIFISFDGEEIGLLGSAYYTKHPLWPMEKTIFMLNLDTIGRLVDKKLYVEGSETSPGLKALLDEINVKSAANMEITYSNIAGGGDQVSFHLAKIPAYFFFSGAHADYHHVTDTMDKINFPGLEQITRLAFRFAGRVANLPVRPEFKEVPVNAMPPSDNKRPYLGAMPDFSANNPKGFQIGEPNPNSPVAKAGLQKGDVILSIDGQPIKGLRELGAVLKSKKVGDTVKIIFLRGDQESTVEATLTERPR